MKNFQLTVLRNLTICVFFIVIIIVLIFNYLFRDLLIGNELHALSSVANTWSSSVRKSSNENIVDSTGKGNVSWRVDKLKHISSLFIDDDNKNIDCSNIPWPIKGNGIYHAYSMEGNKLIPIPVLICVWNAKYELCENIDIVLLDDMKGGYVIYYVNISDNNILERVGKSSRMIYLFNINSHGVFDEECYIPDDTLTDKQFKMIAF
jgi:hypothetical protein